MPDNYVERPEAVKAVKDMLLAEDDRTLVVSAISGLGGLGKSVLATALVLDSEVQARFVDGILWTTLGQNPDLLTMLGNWIWQLDKSRESFSANTVEEASQYLHRLLAEQRMLLVVDDVWDSAHAEWFRIGGPECRVLVTTREAVIIGSERYCLDLMSPQESLDLVMGELGTKWTISMKQPALEFARLLGHLPLAVRLMAVQIARGRKWETLKKAFLKETERLRALDYPGVRLVDLADEERRKYSLRACFGVSLERLQEDSSELFERFVWLGALPEDVILQQQMAMTLWNIEDWEAEETLLILYERSFLTSGVTTVDGEKTYRVHDLMHDMARGFIEQGTLSSSAPNLGLTAQNCVIPQYRQQNLVLAHRQLLERYRQSSTYHCWSKLPNDGYIHHHLTWHLEQGNWNEEIHALIALSDDKGRNAWFEACDRIGQPAIFLEDIARGWRLAEEHYSIDQSQSIVWQCRYALITSTLNSLAKSLPIGMITGFVRRDFWSIEQAWTYVEQIQDEYKIAEAIQELAIYLSKSLFQSAVNKTYKIQAEHIRAKTLCELVKLEIADFNQLLTVAYEIDTQYNRIEVLYELVRSGSASFHSLLMITRELSPEHKKASALIELAKLDTANIQELFAETNEIKDNYCRASILVELGKLDSAYLSEALAIARNIQDEHSRASLLIELGKIDSVYLPEALAIARNIQDEHSRASLLIG